MGQNGGYRPGSGRKKGLATIEREKARYYISERIGEYMPAIFDVLIEKAVVGKDVGAIKELFDRGFGRAPQAIDITSKGESLVNITQEDMKVVTEFESKLNEHVDSPSS